MWENREKIGGEGKGREEEKGETVTVMYAISL